MAIMIEDREMDNTTSVRGRHVSNLASVRKCLLILWDDILPGYLIKQYSSQINQHCIHPNNMAPKKQRKQDTCVLAASHEQCTTLPKLLPKASMNSLNVTCLKYTMKKCCACWETWCMWVQCMSWTDVSTKTHTHTHNTLKHTFSCFTSTVFWVQGL